MKKFTTIKTLLVGLLALGATSVWADEGDVIYSNDFSTNNQADFATWMGTGVVPQNYSNTIIGRNGAFSIETGALVHTAPYGKSKSNVYDGDFGTFKEAITTATKEKNHVISFDITLEITNHIACYSIFELSGEDKKTILCLYAEHTRANKTTGATSYGYIVGGNNAFATKEVTISEKANTEGSIGDGTKHVLAEKINGITGSKTYHVILDVQTAGLAKLTIKEGETTIVNEESVSVSSENGLKWIYFANYNSWETPSSQITIDNFSIVEGAPTVDAVANYKVKYVAEIAGTNTEIKTAESRSGIVGNGITLVDADKNDVFYNDVKYIYNTDDASSKTIADDNSTEVTVSFVEAPSYLYSVTDNLGNTIASGKAYKGNNVDFYVPYFVFKDGKFYQDPKLSSGTLSYGKSTISNISANTEITVTYTEEENTNVVFFSEAENLTGITPYEDNYTQIRMSNGKAGYYAEQTAFTTLPAGVYTIQVATRSGSTTFYAGTIGEGQEVLNITSTGAITVVTKPFALTGESSIYTSTGSQSVYFDYVIIRKIEQVTATITKAGYASFYSPYALDFSSVEGLTAYTASVTGDKVTFTQVAKVPANTGVLLKGSAGKYQIPVVTDGGDATSELVGGTATAPAGSFVLMNENDKVGFYKTKYEFALGANTAYIPSQLLSRDFIAIDGEATAIKAIETNKQGGEIFNLAGQRVNKAQKGLYIQNGKKVIIK